MFGSPVEGLVSQLEALNTFLPTPIQINGTVYQRFRSNFDVVSFEFGVCWVHSETWLHLLSSGDAYILFAFVFSRGVDFFLKALPESWRSLWRYGDDVDIARNRTAEALCV